MASAQGLVLKGLLWVAAGDKRFGGPGRIELLTRVASLGSIRQAAKSMKMSYKAAWDAIDQMNNLADEPVVERETGGKGGGSTRLTARGERLVANFRLIEREHRRFIEQLDREARGLVDDLRLVGRMSMKTSARNQFAGKVVKIVHGAVNDEIEVEIPGGLTITATVTSESTRSLGLETGHDVFALIKAPSVIVMTGVDGTKLSARNRLSGTVSRLRPGAVNTEVVIGLAGGATIAAIVTNESAQALRLEPGMPATAIFKASSVILGVQA